MKRYELWDSETRNLIFVYHSEAEALALVRQAIADHGFSSVSTWGLLWEDDQDDAGGLIAEGDDLAQLAQAINVA